MSNVSKEIKNNLNQYIRLHLRSSFVMSEGVEGSVHLH